MSQLYYHLGADIYSKQLVLCHGLRTCINPIEIQIPIRQSDFAESSDAE
jgi:hypothetical protein